MTGALVRPEDISNLPREQRGQVITQALEESKSWLAVATKGTDPTPIAEFKAWAATVAEMTRQKGLAEEIQLDALEMVRRAERGIGVAIRNGQEAGEIYQRGSNGGASSDFTRTRNGKEETVHAKRSALPDEKRKLTASGFFTGGADMFATYTMTDGVTDEQFDEAVSEARNEGNLSRANVVRKVTKAATPLNRAQRAEKIRELAAAGYTSKQMASLVGLTGARAAETIRDIARDCDIDISADRFTARQKGHDLDPARVVQGTVDAINGVEYGINQLASADYDALTPDQVRAWLDAMETPMRALRALHKELSARARNAR